MQNVKKTLNIAVICGGLSSESEVSRSSANAVAQALRNSYSNVQILELDSNLTQSLLNTKWTAPSILDTRQPHFEAASNASGLIPSRCE